MIRAAALAAASLLLGACASTSHQDAAARQSWVAPTPSAQQSAPPDAGTLMIDSASAMLGQPYRFGGASPGGFDCSGLVVYAAAGAGIRVPRTAAEQWNFGVPVPRAQLKAGDLIFMHLAAKELHVAIALDDQRFIHAPSSGGYVRIDSLGAPPYSRGFIGARRIIPAAASGVSSGIPQ